MFICIGIDFPSYNLSKHFNMDSFPLVQTAKCPSDAGLSSRSRSPAFGRGTKPGKEIRCSQAAGP